MAYGTQYLFVSYAKKDFEAVRSIVHAVQEEYRKRALDVRVWVDLEDLRPGQQWNAEIERTLQNSIGHLVFVSPAAMESDWVRHELDVAARSQERLIIPVILEHAPYLPPPLAMRPWLDLSAPFHN
jgi:hypothetical protein